MRHKPTDWYEFLFLFSLAIVFGVVVFPLIGGTWALPWWLALSLTPLGLILYLATDTTLTNLCQRKGAVIPVTVFIVGSIIGAMVLEGLKSLLS